MNGRENLQHVIAANLTASFSGKLFTMQIKRLFSMLCISMATLTASAFAQAPLTIGASDGPVTIIGAEITGQHSNQAHVAPGATFGLHFFYNIVDTGCPTCLDQIQVGFANALPVICAYGGEPGAGGAAGITNETYNLQLTAPTTDGIYYIAFDRSQARECPTTAWWSGTPQPNQYIAAIAVY